MPDIAKKQSHKGINSVSLPKLNNQLNVLQLTLEITWHYMLVEQRQRTFSAGCSWCCINVSIICEL